MVEELKMPDLALVESPKVSFRPLRQNAPSLLLQQLLDHDHNHDLEYSEGARSANTTPNFVCEPTLPESSDMHQKLYEALVSQEAYTVIESEEETKGGSEMKYGSFS